MWFICSYFKQNYNLLGSGVFATAEFQKGDFLLEYRGTLLNKEEYNVTTRKYIRKDISLIYIFELMHNGQKLLCVFHLKFLLLCVQSLYRKRTSRPLVRMHDLSLVILLLRCRCLAMFFA